MAEEAYSRPQSSIYGNLVHAANISQTFAKFTLKMAGSARKIIWRSGSTRTRWWSLQRSPRLPSWTSREGTGKEEREREEGGKEGKG